MENENNKEKEIVTPTIDADNSVEPSHRTEKDKAIFTFKKQSERLVELGVDPTELVKKPVSENKDEVPEWYRQEKAKEQTHTALQMADKLSDEETREQVKTYLNTRIIPSGNPEQDFKDALGAVSSSKNKQILEEMARATSPRVIASGGSGDGKHEEEFIPTEQERIFMAKPYNMTKEKILEARKKAEAKQV
uniref:Scaffolding protein n=1 Tax=uncultured marine virus TaxID=186617 RepID=A0A0F7L9P2_9VIRU|nr:hypothetical protein [uncultured marine virus]